MPRTLSPHKKRLANRNAAILAELADGVSTNTLAARYRMNPQTVRSVAHAAGFSLSRRAHAAKNPALTIMPGVKLPVETCQHIWKAAEDTPFCVACYEDTKRAVRVATAKTRRAETEAAMLRRIQRGGVA